MGSKMTPQDGTTKVPKFGTNGNTMAKKHSMISGKSGYGATSVKGSRHNCGKSSMMGKGRM